MKTGLTIKEMAQELLRQSKAKQDYLVNTGSLSLSVTSDAPQLRVTENGLDKITPLDIRQTAHRQLGTYLGIPQKYYELMRTDAPELLAYDDVARPLPADEPNGTAGRLSGRNIFKEDMIMYEQTNTMMETKTTFQIPQLLDGDDFTSEDLADDMEGLRLSFTRIKIPGGGHLQFEIPSGNPDVPDYAPYLEGVILYSHNSNAYWPEGSEYDDDQPPLCQSFDGKVGYGEPGGTCADCVLNQFGSDGNNKGKACKNMRMLYLLRSGEYMPIQIALPPTSLTPYTRFVNEAFLSRRRKVCTGVVRIGLKKAVSGSHEYCVATFTKIADFAGEDLAHIRAYADGFVAQIKDINAQRAQAGAAASSIIGDGDASHLELPDNGAHFALGAVIDGEREELPA